MQVFCVYVDKKKPCSQRVRKQKSHMIIYSSAGKKNPHVQPSSLQSQPAIPNTLTFDFKRLTTNALRRSTLAKVANTSVENGLFLKH